MKLNWAAAAGATMMMAFATVSAQADSISGIEGARAKDRAGNYLNRQDREQLRRYGSNHDWRGGYNNYGYYGGGVVIYSDPRGFGPGYQY